MFYKNFSQNLRHLRLQFQYTQEEMSQQLHICRQTYNNYETGQRMPSLEMAGELSRILNVSIDFLIHGELLSASNQHLPQIIELYSQLPPEKQRAVAEFITNCKNIP